MLFVPPPPTSATRLFTHHRQHIGRAEIHIRRQVKTERDETVLTYAKQMAVEINFSNLADRFKFDVNPFAFSRFRQHECFAIPSTPTPLVLFPTQFRQREMLKRVNVVISMRRGNRRPTGVIETGLLRAGQIGFDKLPIRIEI